jgi:cellulose biosynthesis protein BcsQ
MIIAITNQKGGVGKTTTTANLGVLLARDGRRVLLVDADPQFALTRQLGIEERSLGVNLLSRASTSTMSRSPRLRTRSASRLRRPGIGVRRSF